MLRLRQLPHQVSVGIACQLFPAPHSFSLLLCDHAFCEKIHHRLCENPHTVQRSLVQQHPAEFQPVVDRRHQPGSPGFIGRFTFHPARNSQMAAGVKVKPVFLLLVGLSQTALLLRRHKKSRIHHAKRLKDPLL